MIAKPNMQAESLPYRVAVLGDCGVGKTALTIRLCLKRFDEQVCLHGLLLVP